MTRVFVALTKHSRGWTRCVLLIVCSLDVACATVPKPPLPPDPTKEVLGPSPREKCFHVTVERDDRYRFSLVDMRYPNAPAGGGLGVYVRAPGFPDLKPNRIQLRREPDLDFTVTGRAGGAFEVTLFFIDSECREDQSTILRRVCDGPAPARGRGSQPVADAALCRNLLSP